MAATSSFVTQVDEALRAIDLPKGIFWAEADRALYLLPSATPNLHHASFVAYLLSMHPDGERLYYQPVLLGLRTLREPWDDGNWLLERLVAEVGIMAKRFDADIAAGRARLAKDCDILEIDHQKDQVVVRWVPPEER